MSKKVSDRKLLETIISCALEIGFEKLTIKEYQERVPKPWNDIFQRFGGWSKAKRRARVKVKKDLENLKSLISDFSGLVMDLEKRVK